MMLTLGYARSTSGNRFGFWVNHAGTISRRYYEAISLLFSFQMAFKVSLAMLRTPKGLFKILEFVLVLTCILIARFGGGDFPIRGKCDTGNDLGKAVTNDTGKAITIGYLGSSYDEIFLNCGTLLGFEIILIAILLTYLLGAEPAFLVRHSNFMSRSDNILPRYYGSTSSVFCELHLVITYCRS